MKDGKHVILCVDDDQDFLDSLRMILEDSGYVIETATAPRKGFAYKEDSPTSSSST